MPAQDIINISVAAGLTCLLTAVFVKQRSTVKTAELKATLKEKEKNLEDLKASAETKDTLIEKLRTSQEKAEQEKAVVAARLEEKNNNLEEQKKILENAQAKLKDTFAALSGESLKSNNRAFLELAKASLDKIMTEAKGEFGQKEKSIKTMLSPLEETLKRYEKQILDMEKNRSHAYGSITEQLKTMALTETSLKKETLNLVSALKRPEAKGRWGEITLQRVLEIAGMTEHCDFRQQVSIKTSENKDYRTDMIVYLPGDREIVIDSKLPLTIYTEASETDDEEQKHKKLEMYAKQLKKHLNDLASKAYWNSLPKAPEFIIMFIPIESSLYSALQFDPTLLEEGLEKRVLLTTPTTLIAILRSIAYGWKQEKVSENAAAIAQTGKILFDRFRIFIDHMEKSSKSLGSTVDHFNKMIGSMQSRLVPSLNEFKKYGAAPDETIKEIKQISNMPIKPDADI